MTPISFHCVHRAGSFLGCFLWAVFTVAFVTGCGTSDDSQRVRSSSTVAKTLLDGAQVELLEEEGQYARVRASSGEGYWIRRSLLMSRSDADESSDSYTHILSTSASGFEKPPSQNTSTKPREPADILREQHRLNRVWLTADSGRRIIASGDKQPKVDGQKCWPAYYCTNPDCPKAHEQEDGFPFLFCNSTSGTLTYCPACRPLWKDSQDDSGIEWQYRNYPSGPSDLN